MSCASCANSIEKAIRSVPGVASATVNFAAATANVTFDDAPIPDAVIAAVASAGYEAVPDRAGDNLAADSGEPEAGRYRRAALIAAVLTAPIVGLDMGSHFIPSFHRWLDAHIAASGLQVFFLLLASAVQFGPGLRFYRHGLAAVKRMAPDMNSLVMIGTSAAWLYSSVTVLLPRILPADAHHVYFEASATVITLILVGRWLEARSRGKTSKAIQHLAALRPAIARVKRPEGPAEIPVADVRPGDLVVLRPGERLPVDGEVVEGETYIDQSMITGEPMPVLRRPGDAVVGGTINTTGSVVYRATSLGADSVLARIIEMVRNAQSAKLPIQALVDRVTAIFVPLVLALATLTFLVWLVVGPSPALTLAVINAVAVLIIACPCAMGLATPTSIMVGTGRGASTGILFRKGDALQTLTECTTVAFDKTGTLTVGAPTLTRVGTTDRLTEDEALQLAATVEAHSEHPLALAVVDAAGKRGINAAQNVRGFEAVSGLGVRAEVDGSAVIIGSQRFLEQNGITVANVFGSADAHGGETILHLARDGRHLASFAVSDPIRDSTPEAIRILHENGFKLAMVTGDTAAAAHGIAARLGIDDVQAAVLPDGKVAAIKRLQRAGKVAFVGDGINDAPALAAADVGITIGSATAIAVESAEVVLVTGDLRKVAAAIRLSRATLRNIRQNLFWAFAYNTALIPVAAGVLYPAFGILLSPVFAAIAMTLSSLCVVTNALRLRSLQL